MIAFLKSNAVLGSAAVFLVWVGGFICGWHCVPAERPACAEPARMVLVPCPACGPKTKTGCGCGGQCCPARGAAPAAGLAAPGPEPAADTDPDPRLWLPPLEPKKTSYVAAKKPRSAVYAVIQVMGGYRVALCSDQVYATPALASVAAGKVRAYCLGKGITFHLYVPFPCLCDPCVCPAPCSCGLILRPAPVLKVEGGGIRLDIEGHLKRVEKLRLIKKTDPKKRLRKPEKR